uniref:Uncharacterized protein n=1 Tax=Chromera velia CCMP2878 TaxID=1169474 RepID=A0A0G4G9E3_9ALVE|eukprot:Cvel_20829.t1-p1 / transcript=Cvel_20829.t1 / gene=Cvel_20829 / organism=Chromera_velia_CCMP2878 / gene_product=hypothetical protein / transcript_product=hypothetical protein / location=Cvel_scaffold1905:21317-31058(+) / protein_length=2133 / sequence_SO=supercontig / SO=protein_coding / is_pseudo=false
MPKKRKAPNTANVSKRPKAPPGSDREGLKGSEQAISGHAHASDIKEIPVQTSIPEVSALTSQLLIPPFQHQAVDPETNFLPERHTDSFPSSEEGTHQHSGPFGCCNGVSRPATEVSVSVPDDKDGDEGLLVMDSDSESDAESEENLQNDYIPVRSPVSSPFTAFDGHGDDSDPFSVLSSPSDWDDPEVGRTDTEHQTNKEKNEYQVFRFRSFADEDRTLTESQSKETETEESPFDDKIDLRPEQSAPQTTPESLPTMQLSRQGTETASRSKGRTEKENDTADQTIFLKMLSTPSDNKRFLSLLMRLPPCTCAVSCGVCERSEGADGNNQQASTCPLAAALPVDLGCISFEGRRLGLLAGFVDAEGLPLSPADSNSMCCQRAREKKGSVALFIRREKDEMEGEEKIEKKKTCVASFDPSIRLSLTPPGTPGCSVSDARREMSLADMDEMEEKESAGMNTPSADLQAMNNNSTRPLRDKTEQPQRIGMKKRLPLLLGIADRRDATAAEIFEILPPSFLLPSVDLDSDTVCMTLGSAARPPTVTPVESDQAGGGAKFFPFRCRWKLRQALLPGVHPSFFDPSIERLMDALRNLSDLPAPVYLWVGKLTSQASGEGVAVVVVETGVSLQGLAQAQQQQEGEAGVGDTVERPVGSSHERLVWESESVSVNLMDLTLKRLVERVASDLPSVFNEKTVSGGEGLLSRVKEKIEADETKTEAETERGVNGKAKKKGKGKSKSSGEEHSRRQEFSRDPLVIAVKTRGALGGAEGGICGGPCFFTPSVVLCEPLRETFECASIALPFPKRNERQNGVEVFLSLRPLTVGTLQTEWGDAQTVESLVTARFPFFRKRLEQQGADGDVLCTDFLDFAGSRVRVGLQIHGTTIEGFDKKTKTMLAVEMFSVSAYIETLKPVQSAIRATVRLRGGGRSVVTIDPRTRRSGNTCEVPAECLSRHLDEWRGAFELEVLLSSAVEIVPPRCVGEDGVPLWGPFVALFPSAFPPLYTHPFKREVECLQKTVELTGAATDGRGGSASFEIMLACFDAEDKSWISIAGDGKFGETLEVEVVLERTRETAGVEREDEEEEDLKRKLTFDFAGVGENRPVKSKFWSPSVIRKLSKSHSRLRLEFSFRVRQSFRFPTEALSRTEDSSRTRLSDGVRPLLGRFACDAVSVLSFLDKRRVDTRNPTVTSEEMLCGEHGFTFLFELVKRRGKSVELLTSVRRTKRPPKRNGEGGDGWMSAVEEEVSVQVSAQKGPNCCLKRAYDRLGFGVDASSVCSLRVQTSDLIGTPSDTACPPGEGPDREEGGGPSRIVLEVRPAVPVTKARELKAFSHVDGRAVQAVYETLEWSRISESLWRNERLAFQQVEIQGIVLRLSLRPYPLPRLIAEILHLPLDINAHQLQISLKMEGLKKAVRGGGGKKKQPAPLFAGPQLSASLVLFPSEIGPQSVEETGVPVEEELSLGGDGDSNLAEFCRQALSNPLCDRITITAQMTRQWQGEILNRGRQGRKQSFLVAFPDFSDIAAQLCQSGGSVWTYPDVDLNYQFGLRFGQREVQKHLKEGEGEGVSFENVCTWVLVQRRSGTSEHSRRASPSVQVFELTAADGESRRLGPLCVFDLWELEREGGVSGWDVRIRDQEKEEGEADQSATLRVEQLCEAVSKQGDRVILRFEIQKGLQLAEVTDVLRASPESAVVEVRFSHLGSRVGAMEVGEPWESTPFPVGDCVLRLRFCPLFAAGSSDTLEFSSEFSLEIVNGGSLEGEGEGGGGCEGMEKGKVKAKLWWGAPGVWTDGGEGLPLCDHRGKGERRGRVVGRWEAQCAALLEAAASPFGAEGLSVFLDVEVTAGGGERDRDDLTFPPFCPPMPFDSFVRESLPIPLESDPSLSWCGLHGEGGGVAEMACVPCSVPHAALVTLLESAQLLWANEKAPDVVVTGVQTVVRGDVEALRLAFSLSWAIGRGESDTATLFQAGVRLSELCCGGWGAPLGMAVICLDAPVAFATWEGSSVVLENRLAFVMGEESEGGEGRRENVNVLSQQFPFDGSAGGQVVKMESNFGSDTMEVWDALVMWWRSAHGGESGSDLALPRPSCLGPDRVLTALVCPSPVSLSTVGFVRFIKAVVGDSWVVVVETPRLRAGVEVMAGGD